MRKPTKKKNRLKPGATPFQGSVVCLLLFGLTLLRLHVATSGSLNESEAMLDVCATHPAGAYLEGPAGVPLLLGLKNLLFGSSESGIGFLALRCVSPLAALLLSWCVWWMGRQLAPQRPFIALGAVVLVNLLPTVNLASLVMDGAMLTASMILLCIISGWNAVQAKRNQVLAAWILFGAALGAGTFFYCPVGFLFPVAVVVRLISQGIKPFPWQAFLLAMILLAAGWISPVLWNLRHDWLQWSSVAAGFDSSRFLELTFPLGPVTAFSAALVPLLLLLAVSNLWWRGLTLLAALLLSTGSAIILLLPQELPSGLPSPVGVEGLEPLTKSLMALHEQQHDPHGQEEGSFLIASTPGLAALLDARIRLNYPECPDAPSVFTLESPSMNSSFALWPGYADAVAPAAKDILYSEEKYVSPFLGHNALYITTESLRELPQTLTGAFASVRLVQEIPVTWNGRPITIRLYQCERYRALSL